jgi:GT2 family glycosyltransferase
VIVISYSLRHFNPDNPELVLGSAGQIAREIFYAAQEIVGINNVKMVDAIDLTTWKKPTREVDTLVTIESNALAAKKFFNPSRVLFISVNHHPAARKQLLKRAFSQGFPKEALDSTDGISENGEGARIGDKILQIGDIESIKSYLSEGVKLKDIYPVSYKPFHHDWSSNDQQEDILCHLGSLGYRKGLDLILSLAEKLSELNSTKIIHVTGIPVNTYWKAKCDYAAQKYQNNLKFHGWVEPKSSDFSKLLNLCRLAIFPTREEGMSGAYLEVALSGIPTITTRKVGIETAPLLTMKTVDINGLLDRFDNVECEYNLAKSWASFTKKMYESINQDSNQIGEAAKRFFLSGRVWPEVNLILPVHNKAKTIKKLIRMLTQAAYQMDNSVLTLIDDGSSDNTFHFLMKFIKSKKIHRTFKEVKLHRTPDIFEVKSNNFGIKQSDSDFHVIIQDDNMIYEDTLLAEMISLASRYQSIAALGGLAGVNFFPIAQNCASHSPGQHIATDLEHYWRQDMETDASMGERYFQVDAVMRGPLLLSGQAIRKIGLLDERYAPLYSDDMAWCFNARSQGFEVFALVGGVLNESATMSKPTEAQNSIYIEAFRNNSKLFYEEWKPQEEKPYLFFERKIWGTKEKIVKKVKRFLKIPVVLNVRTLKTYVSMNFPRLASTIKIVRKLSKFK